MFVNIMTGQMNEYHLRVDLKTPEEKKVFEKWFSAYDKKFEKYLLVEEIAKVTKKYHMHAYIETILNIDTLRTNFRRSNKQERSEYSLSKAKHNKRTLCYVAKDGKILKRKNISDKDIDEASTEIKILNKKNSIKTIDKMYLYVQEHIGSRIDRYEVAEQMMDYCAKESLAVSAWTMKSYYQIIHWKLRKREGPNFDRKLFFDELFGFGDKY